MCPVFSHCPSIVVLIVQRPTHDTCPTGSVSCMPNASVLRTTTSPSSCSEVSAGQTAMLLCCLSDSMCSVFCRTLYCTLNAWPSYDKLGDKTVWPALLVAQNFDVLYSTFSRKGKNTILRVLYRATYAQSSASTLRNHPRAQYNSNLSTIKKDKKTYKTMIRPYAKKSTSNKLEPIKFVGGSKYMKERQRTAFLRHTTASSRLPTAL